MVVRVTAEEKDGGSNLQDDQENGGTQERTGNRGVPKKLFKWNEEVRLVYFFWGSLSLDASASTK